MANIKDVVRAELQVALDKCVTLEDLENFGKLCLTKSQGTYPKDVYPNVWQGCEKTKAPYDRLELVPLVKGLRNHTGIQLRMCKVIVEHVMKVMPQEFKDIEASPIEGCGNLMRRVIPLDMCNHINHPLRIAARIVHKNKARFIRLEQDLMSINSQEVVTIADSDRKKRNVDNFERNLHNILSDGNYLIEE
ncbi:hypothetical protein GR7B_00209 [Vibrio phage vB_VcorM_GR7B]|nr:hypothetical protein GR7B_00209 [Vibrio phage vB_VcorM_GR7B]